MHLQFNRLAPLIVSSIFFFSVLVFGSKCFPSSCCGGGATSASVITGDELAMVSSEFSYSTIGMEVSNSGIWQERTNPETLKTLKIQGAHVFFDRFQIGVGLPMIQRVRADQESSGLGDLALNIGYEVLPEWEYSAWRPRAVSYMTLIAPTGRSIQESTNALQLDSRGRGFWAVGLGTTFTKLISKFDILTTIEIHRSFKKELKTPTIEGELEPGIGGNFTVGGGYTFANSRLSVTLTSTYEDAVATRGFISSPGAPSRFTTIGLSASQSLNEDWRMSLAYSDQTLFGAPTNTTLAKSFGIALNRGFPR